jgi:putative ABC transport system substrate-binding protein
VKRRDFIAFAGGAIFAAPFGAVGQPLPLPIVGFLNTTSSGPAAAPLLDAFRKGLAGMGYIEGKTVAIEYRWAEGQYDRLEALATDLVRRKATVIAATGGTVAAKAAKTITSTTPILFIAGFDPVREGLVASINRPGGNATGVGVYTAELGRKRLAMLHQLVPGRSLAMLVNPESISTAVEIKDAQEASRVLDFELIVLEAKTEREIENAFSQGVSRGAAALLVSADSFFTSRRAEIVQLAAHHALPVCYPWPQYTAAGGLISYGTNLTWAYEQIGSYAGRILKGDKPENLPVLLPDKFELTINLKTAKSLAISIPPILLVGADRVIEPPDEPPSAPRDRMMN